ncbi:cysteine methyltransferase [Ahniella affigens]|uniref:Cysteine methyltransferase n=1 Tax=Ahniella affigens TaxID=2021234 RepID=A0A2P1PM33_9GAMM|nr:methylated-DNA--[protein]-cysteine S-methyltransferase [Ahniella affigens]AVP95896.1 cysteine methyltransferase [Ahniella affigens]
MSLPSPEECLHAVQTRDARFDGRFVYGVLSTTIFCRPSCPSRPARPEHLRWFDTPGAAINAGFRPCKRCRPEQTEQSDQILERLSRWLIEHADANPSLDDLAAMGPWSPTQLQKRFKAWLGISPKQLLDATRSEVFKAALKRGMRITDAIMEAGFGSSSRVYGEPLRHLGMSPKSWRSGAAGEQIFFASTDTALGRLMMAATETGVCFAEFGTDDAALLAKLRQEFPNATLRESPARESSELATWLQALSDHLEHDQPRPNVPLDLRGTALQIKVWRFLLGTEIGSRHSYSEVARAIGADKAHRAVASACAANRIAILVPCHRVLSASGSLAGYRWGLARKRALLAQEALAGPALAQATTTQQNVVSD